MGRLVSWMAAVLLVSAMATALAAPKLQPFDHVFVIVMENHGSDSIVGDPTMPYVNHLIRTYGYEDNYFGVTHPSMPNYIAMTSGTNYFSHSDNPDQLFPHTNVFDEMEAAGLTWRGYMGSLPYAGYTGAAYPTDTKHPLYVNKHDPFVLYSQIKSDPARMKNVVPLTQLATDLAAGHAANLSFIVPNVCNDMHGMSGQDCNYGNDTRLRGLGNATIKRLVATIMSSSAWSGNSAIFITWDETDYTGNKETGGWGSVAGGPDTPVLLPGSKLLPKGGKYGGGRVPLIVISSRFPGHVVVHQLANHYSLLRTVEQAWQLPYLGYTSDSLQVHALTAFFEAH